MRVLIAHDGPFGAAVAARLARRFPDARQLALADACRDDAAIAGSDVVLVALWRRCHSALERLDAACHRAGIRWSLAVLDGTTLVTGPLVIPGAGACFACFWRRYLAHARTPQWELALVNAYDRDPTRGPDGFCPAAVGMAAAALAADAGAPVDRAGRIWRTSLLGSEVTETRVVKVHGCARCGVQRQAPSDRFVAELVPRLEEMLS